MSTLIKYNDNMLQVNKHHCYEKINHVVYEEGEM